MLERRSFLRGLTTLPLIGGGVTLIGSPTATAVPITENLVAAYDEWLDLERSYLRWERFGDVRKASPEAEIEVVFRDRRTGKLFDTHAVCDPRQRFDHAAPMPSNRAALVLSAAGYPLPAVRS